MIVTCTFLKSSSLVKNEAYVTIILQLMVVIFVAFTFTLFEYIKRACQIFKSNIS